MKPANPCSSVIGVWGKCVKCPFRLHRNRLYESMYSTVSTGFPLRLFVTTFDGSSCSMLCVHYARLVQAACVLVCVGAIHSK